MLQRPTLLPNSMRMGTRLTDASSLPMGMSSDATNGLTDFGTFDDEVVIVEPTDPDEDRILQEELDRVTCSNPFSTSIVINRSHSTNNSLSNQSTSVVSRSTVHSTETVPAVQIVEAPKSIGAVSVNDVLQSLLSATARVNQFQSISIQPLLTTKVNTLPSLNNQAVATPLSTLLLPATHTTTATNTVPISSSNTSITSSFEDITKVAQQLAPLNPLVAAVLVNCATVNLISQLAGSVGTTVYNTGAFASSSLQNVNTTLSSLLSTLFSNFGSNVQPSEDAGSNNVVSNLREAKQLEQPVKNQQSTDSAVPPQVYPTTPVSSSTLNSTESFGRTSVRIKRFKCPAPNCTMAFYSRFNLAEHVRTHTGERPFACPDVDCPAAFKRRRDLRDHWNTHLARMSNSALVLDCDAKMDAISETKIAVGCAEVPGCSVSSDTAPTPVSSIPLDTGDITVKVEEKTDTVVDCRDTDYHQIDGHSIISRYRCPFLGCDKSYARRHRLNQHVSWHTGTKPFQCDEPNCKVRYYCEGDLRRHKVSHLNTSDRSNRRRHACSYPNCGKAYSKMNKLKEHVRSHTGERPYVCREPGCGAAFVRLYGVRRHELTHVFGRRREKNQTPFHTAVPSVVDESRIETSVPQLRPLRAEQSVSSAITDTVSSILASLGLKNSGTCEASSDVSTPSIPRTLPAIAPKTTTLVSLRPLSPISGPPGMRRPHICPYKDCGKAFPKLNKLREHVCRHTGERPYACDKCTASFVRMYDLRRHSNIHLRGVEPRNNSRVIVPRQHELQTETTSPPSNSMRQESETVTVN